MNQHLNKFQRKTDVFLFMQKILNLYFKAFANMPYQISKSHEWLNLRVQTSVAKNICTLHRWLIYSFIWTNAHTLEYVHPILVGIKLASACRFHFTCGMVFALNHSHLTRIGLRETNNIWNLYLSGAW